MSHMNFFLFFFYLKIDGKWTKLALLAIFLKRDFSGQFSTTVHRIFPLSGMHRCVSYTQAHCHKVHIWQILVDFWCACKVVLIHAEDYSTTFFGQGIQGQSSPVRKSFKTSKSNVEKCVVQESTKKIRIFFGFKKIFSTEFVWYLLNWNVVSAHRQMIDQIARGDVSCLLTVINNPSKLRLSWRILSLFFFLLLILLVVSFIIWPFLSCSESHEQDATFTCDCF